MKVQGSGRVRAGVLAALVVGGGAVLLGNMLNLVAGGVNKAVVAENPVLSISYGLYKLDMVK